MTLPPARFYPCSTSCPTGCVFMVSLVPTWGRPVCRRCALRLLQLPNSRLRITGADPNMLIKMAPLARYDRKLSR